MVVLLVCFLELYFEIQKSLSGAEAKCIFRMRFLVCHLITCSGKKESYNTNRSSPQNPHTAIERIWGLELSFT